LIPITSSIDVEVGFYGLTMAATSVRDGGTGQAD